MHNKSALLKCLFPSLVHNEPLFIHGYYIKPIFVWNLFIHKKKLKHKKRLFKKLLLETFMKNDIQQHINQLLVALNYAIERRSFMRVYLAWSIYLLDYSTKSIFMNSEFAGAMCMKCNWIFCRNGLDKWSKKQAVSNIIAQ